MYNNKLFINKFIPTYKANHEQLQFQFYEFIFLPGKNIIGPKAKVAKLEKVSKLYHCYNFDFPKILWR